MGYFDIRDILTQKFVLERKLTGAMSQPEGPSRAEAERFIAPLVGLGLW